MACRPWWSKVFDRWKSTVINSGCRTVRGMVQCDPDSMRAHAESLLHYTGALSADDGLSLEAYTLGRYIASEIGSGTTEEQVAVAEAAVNRARMMGGTVIDVLLRKATQASAVIRSYGYYGPTHADDATCASIGQKTGCHPFGRWAATSRDPSVAHLLVARFVLDGNSQNFARGADNQNGPTAGVRIYSDPQWPYKAVTSKAAEHSYWVGYLPGVDHWKTFLYRSMPDVSPSSSDGQALVSAAYAALRAGAPNWSRTPICGGGLVSLDEPVNVAKTFAALASVAVLALGVGLGAGLLHERRWH